MARYSERFNCASRGNADGIFYLGERNRVKNVYQTFECIYECQIPLRLPLLSRFNVQSFYRFYLDKYRMAESSLKR